MKTLENLNVQGKRVLVRVDRGDVVIDGDDSTRDPPAEPPAAGAVWW